MRLPQPTSLLIRELRRISVAPFNFARRGYEERHEAIVVELILRARGE